MMKEKFYLVGVLMFISALVSGQLTTSAFPGAEGGGMLTTGGRGGNVYFVTSLEDASTGNASTREGTLRWCLAQTGPRTIIFKVAGIIRLKSALKINANTTLAGQSAPGDGICLADYPVQLNGSNIIIRYLRFRMGDVAKQEGDALWGRNYSNIIIDHCSMSWSTDECSSFYDNTNFTLQWCILSESLRVSVHDKGTHGYGGIWGGKKASFHHNLLAHHDSRNPRFCGSRYSNQPALELVDFRNNVLYNWGGNSAYAGEGGSYNIVNNYYKPGPGTKSSVSGRIFQPYADGGSNSQPAGVWGTFFVSGNYIHNNASVTNNNWLGIHPNPSTKSKDELKSLTEFQVPFVTTHTAEEAFNLVLAHAGASFKRDNTDARIVNEAQNRLPSVNRASNGTTMIGIIDSQTDVGGWDHYNFEPNSIPADTDRDGMPDPWEVANNLNPNEASDRNNKNEAGYTQIELFLNSLLDSGPSTSNQQLDARKIAKAYPNPCSGFVRIQFYLSSEQNAQITLTDISGKKVQPELKRKFYNGFNELHFDMNNFMPGIYFCHIQTENGKDQTLKLAIKR